MPKKFVGEPNRVSLISGIEKIYASEGYVTVFRRKFFVSQYRNKSLRNPSVLWFRKFLVAKKFMDKKEGEVSSVPSKSFCLTVPKKAVGEPFSLSLISGIEKVWVRRWGECQDFRSKISCLTVPKKFVGQPFRVSLISGIEKIYASEVDVTISCRNFCLSVPELFVGEPLSLSLISGVEKN